VLRAPALSHQRKELEMRHRCATILALGAGALLARRSQLRAGATDDETRASLPGDELIAHAGLTATRAISIGATRDRVWPWIAQLGQGRGGFYSYDVLENLAGCDIHSAERVVPEWQSISVGDDVRLAPDVALRVVAVDRGRSLVLRGGIPMGPVAAPYDFTWAFVLRDGPAGSVRLLVRERYGYTRGWAPLLVEPVSLVSFVMTRRMLRGIRRRATQG
jgi:hypothetical protein